MVEAHPGNVDGLLRGFPTEEEVLARSNRATNHRQGSPRPWFETAVMVVYRVLGWIGVVRAHEMKTAILEARNCGAVVVLGDRAVEPTKHRELRRSPQDVVKDLVEFRSVLVSLIKGDVLSREAVRKLNSYTKERSPIAERARERRDDLMYHNLLGCKGKTIVAVVGQAHMDGIEKRFLERAPDPASTPVEFYKVTKILSETSRWHLERTSEDSI